MSVNKILSKETLHRVISLWLQSTFMYLPSPLNNLLYIMYILHTFVCIVLYKELFSIATIYHYIVQQLMPGMKWSMICWRVRENTAKGWGAYWTLMLSPWGKSAGMVPWPWGQKISTMSLLTIVTGSPAPDVKV